MNLKSLHLSDTKVNSIVIHKVCRNLTKLQVLELRNCKLIDDSVLATIEATTTMSSTLQTLDVSQCPVTETVLGRLEKKFETLTIINNVHINLD